MDGQVFRWGGFGGHQSLAEQVGQGELIERCIRTKADE